MKTISVLLVDDHRLVRAGIRALLQGLPDIQVVEEASSGHEALDLIARLQPHVVLMDIGMEGLNGLEATERVTKGFPQTRVIILSMHATEQHVLRALKAGAAGYLLKGAAIDDLELAIRAVARGEVFLDSAVARHVADAATRSEDHVPPSERLTPRQREVLQMVAEGKTTKEIAQTLKISTKTVKTHRTQLMQALDIHDIAGLVRYAIRMGITREE